MELFLKLLKCAYKLQGIHLIIPPKNRSYAYTLKTTKTFSFTFSDWFPFHKVAVQLEKHTIIN